MKTGVGESMSVHVTFIFSKTNTIEISFQRNLNFVKEKSPLNNDLL